MPDYEMFVLVCMVIQTVMQLIPLIREFSGRKNKEK